MNGATTTTVTTKEELMQRTAVLALTAAAVTATLLTGCSDASDDDRNPCGAQPIVYVEREDGEDEYHCGSTAGSIVPVYLIDMDTQHKAKSTPGKAVPFKPAPKPAAPKVNVNKPAAPAPKPAAPKAPAAPRPAGKR